MEISAPTRMEIGTDIASGAADYTLHKLSGWGERRKRGRDSALLAHFIPGLPGNASVLEIGPGHGYFADACIRNGYDYTGVEPSTDLREKLLLRGVRALDHLLPSIPSEDASMDLIHSYDVVEHLPDFESILAFFKEAQRVLKPGGYLSTVVPNCETLGMLFFKYEYQHSFLTTRFRLESMLRDCGFRIHHSRAFLTDVGLTRWRILDRAFAHASLLFMRSPLFSSVLESILGRNFVFKVSKNLFDHVGIVASRA